MPSYQIRIEDSGDDDDGEGKRGVFVTVVSKHANLDPSFAVDDATVEKYSGWSLLRNVNIRVTPAQTLLPFPSHININTQTNLTSSTTKQNPKQPTTPQTNNTNRQNGSRRIMRKFPGLLEIFSDIFLTL